MSIKRDAESVWNSCLAFLKDKLNAESFKMWFMPIKPLKLEDNRLSVVIPSKFFHEYIETHFIDVLKTAIHNELGASAQLTYIVKKEPSYGGNPLSMGAAPQSINPEKIAQNNAAKLNREITNPFIIPGISSAKIESNLNTTYDFENFVEGSCNRLARSVGMEIAKKPGGTSFNPLFVFGDVGLGKTHLANAIGLEAKKRYPEKAILYVTVEKFSEQYGEACSKNDKNNFIHFYQNIDVLIVDDIQLLSGKTGTQNVFFNIFNHLHQNGKQVVMTSDKAPVNMQDIEQRLLSRFKWGLSAELGLPDYTTRLAIIKHKIKKDGISMPPEVIEYIAQNIKSSIRELEGVIVSLGANVFFNRQEITLDLVKSITENYVKNSKKEISIDYIQKTISDYFKTDIEQIQSKTRKREVVQARQIAMYFAKKYTKASLASIGNQIGNRDHATVLHACKMVNNLMDSDRHFHRYIEELDKKFSP